MKRAIPEAPRFLFRRVSCPRCGAKKGQPCRKLGFGYGTGEGFPAVHFHTARKLRVRVPA